jgi:hypothetical protein
LGLLIGVILKRDCLKQEMPRPEWPGHNLVHWG